MNFIIVITHTTDVGVAVTFYFTLQGLTADRDLAATFQDRSLAQGVADRYNSSYKTLRAHVEELNP